MEAQHDHGTESHAGVRYAEWQKPYEEALIEFDKSKLAERVAAAERAILNRREKILEDPRDKNLGVLMASASRIRCRHGD